MSNTKPIFIVYYNNNSPSRIDHNKIEAFLSKKFYDYHVLVVPTGSTEHVVDFECFYEKDITEITFKELKDYVTELVTKERKDIEELLLKVKESENETKSE